MSSISRQPMHKGRTVKDERPSWGELAELISRLDERTAGPEEVRRLLGEFVTCVSNGETPPAQLLRCLRNSFTAYLDGSQGSLDKAFLLTRGTRGHPGADTGR